MLQLVVQQGAGAQGAGHSTGTLRQRFTHTVYSSHTGTFLHTLNVSQYGSIRHSVCGTIRVHVSATMWQVVYGTW